ncbi:hypothetical protein ACNFJN_04065 [Xenorhabdus budapestensis]|uniref:Transposase n=1 Tax=Xenorhabdus budapestensis TaxID=290110 RepID=A0ABX7VQ02_XENBU|nr:hypothetical protein [Xenorhabdus budapestensis]QTL41822.1 hypothetical protein HGO23_03935 [Xenorhabdus budapestensis]
MGRFSVIDKVRFFIRHFALIKFRSPNGAYHYVKNFPSPDFSLSLDELVPKNHPVRKLEAAIDFEFIRELVAP